MNFNLTNPCSTCPFRHDVKPFLNYDRVIEIGEGIIERDWTFSCHKTTSHDEEENHIPKDDEQHCAGALILLEKLKRPNQMTRIAERLGFYDRHKLKMDSPIYDSIEEMAEAQDDY